WHKRGIQTNVLFAGAFLTGNITNPNIRNTRTNLGIDFFAIAVPTTNTMYRGGIESKGEAIKQLPTRMNGRIGHPFWTFGKIDLNLGLEHQSYQLDDTTAPGFAVPSDTFVISPGVSLQYSRWGYSLSGFYDYNARTKWEPWGIPSEYNPNQKTFTDFGAEF